MDNVPVNVEPKRVAAIPNVDQAAQLASSRHLAHGHLDDVGTLTKLAACLQSGQCGNLAVSILLPIKPETQKSLDQQVYVNGHSSRSRKQIKKSQLLDKAKADLKGVPGKHTANSYQSNIDHVLETGLVCDYKPPTRPRGDTNSNAPISTTTTIVSNATTPF